MRIPKHVGIIPDGNRRWAQKNGLEKQKGYEHGLNPGLRLLRQAREYGIEELTYYGFTLDNCKRPKVQLEAFQRACVDAIKLIEKEDVSILVVGDTTSKCFPKELLPYTNCDRTNIRDGQIKVNFLVNYGWEWDLKNGLYSKDISRMQMIVRWGGMCRLSGFLPVQSVYADFFVVKEFWPDFKEEHLKEALEWYQNQDVTLGG